MAAKPVSL